MTEISGIYLLRNTVNGKVYVGQSIHIRRRWHEHKKYAKWGHKSHLYDAIRKYGKEAFAVEVLEECSPIDFDAAEHRWMEHYDCRNSMKGYNQMPAGQYGRIMDDETRERIASKLRGRKLPPERVEQMRKYMTGYKHSDEAKAKISAGNKGRPKSEEAVRKLAAALVARHAAMTPEEKEAYAAQRRGFKHTDETRQRMSAQRRGKPKSEAHRAKMSEARKNADPIKDALRRERLSVANKKRWDAWRAQKAMGAI